MTDAQREEILVGLYSLFFEEGIPDAVMEVIQNASKDPEGLSALMGCMLTCVIVNAEKLADKLVFTSIMSNSRKALYIEAVGAVDKTIPAPK